LWRRINGITALQFGSTHRALRLDHHRGQSTGRLRGERGRGRVPRREETQNLNKYAEKFRTAQSAGLGQVLDGDPSFVTGCDVDAAEAACDYPRYELDKIASKKFVDKGGPAARLVQNFQWSNDEQDTVASFIAKYEMSPDEAAKRWVEANPDRVEDWLTKAKP
jgi:hypothetical protein